MAETPDREVLWPVSLKEQFIALHQADWRIRESVAGVCPNHRSGSGLAIDSLLNYQADDREIVAEAIGLTELPQIISVASNSPAERSGIEPGDVIVSIAGSQLELSFEDKIEPFDFSGAALRRIEAEGFKSISLGLERSGEPRQVVLELDRICAGYSELVVSEKRKAYADLENVAITTGLLSFLENRDELAFTLAHELAHTIYADSRRNGFSRRAKERRADEFATYALRCSGLDPVRGASVLHRLDKTNWLSFLGSVTHAGGRKRIKRVTESDGSVSCDDPAALDTISQNARS